MRARVPVGKRRLAGIVVALHDRRPEGVTLRPVEQILDREPAITPDLLELARFASSYYLAPLGEVLRSMLPGDLPAWGGRKVWLTDAGAIAPPRDAAEAAIVQALRLGGRLTIAELQAQSGLADLEPALARLLEGGRVGSEEETARGARYVTAVELAPGDPEVRRAALRRSPAGSSAIEYLEAIGRPATVAEVAVSAGCSPEVVRRLASRGLLRRFSQIEKLALDRHMMGEGGGAAPEITLRADQQGALEAPRPPRSRGASSPPSSSPASPARGRPRSTCGRRRRRWRRGGRRSSWSPRSPSSPPSPAPSNGASAPSSPSFTRGSAPASGTRSGSGCGAARRGWCSDPARPSSPPSRPASTSG